MPRTPPPDHAAFRRQLLRALNSDRCLNQICPKARFRGRVAVNSAQADHNSASAFTLYNGSISALLITKFLINQVLSCIKRHSETVLDEGEDVVHLRAGMAA